MDRKLKIGGIYKHFKGDLYIVEDVAHHSETHEELICYRGLYGNATLYARPYDDFMSEVEGKSQKYRFELQNIKSKNPDITRYPQEERPIKHYKRMP